MYELLMIALGALLGILLWPRGIHLSLVDRWLLQDIEKQLREIAHLLRMQD